MLFLPGSYAHRESGPRQPFTIIQMSSIQKVSVSIFHCRCGHCKRLAPTWDELAKVYNVEGSAVTIGKVCCTFTFNQKTCLNLFPPCTTFVVCLSPMLMFLGTVKPVLSGHSKRSPKIGFQDQLSLHVGQKYCTMLQGEHSAIFSTFIKLPFVF